MSNYEANALIKEYIEKKDIKGLRSALTGIILRDRNFSTGDFDKSVDYIVNKCGIKELYQPLEKKEKIISNSIKDRSVSKKDFSDAVYELKGNFCHERIEEVKKIGKKLYPKEEKNWVEDNSQFNDEKKQQSHYRKVKQAKKNRIDTKTILKGVIVVAAVAAIAIIIKRIK